MMSSYTNLSWTYLLDFFPIEIIVMTTHNVRRAQKNKVGNNYLNKTFKYLTKR